MDYGMFIYLNIFKIVYATYQVRSPKKKVPPSAERGLALPAAEWVSVEEEAG